MSYRFWTLGEDRRLREMIAEKCTYEQIARALGRSKSATCKRVERLGLCPQGEHRRWTPGQDRVIDETVDQLVTVLSSRLSRSQVSIRARIVSSLFRSNRRRKAQMLEV